MSKFFNHVESIVKEPGIFIGFFMLLNAISREIYHQSLMCDFLFIVEALDCSIISL